MVNVPAGEKQKEWVMIDLLLRNGTLDGTDRLDLAIDKGIIIDRGAGLDYAARHEYELAGRLLIPGFVESHVHLDIALMNPWDRAGRPEPYRSIPALNETLERRRKSFTQEEIVARAGRALELASRHGVTALRAQCHVDPEVGLSHLEALLEVKEMYAELVTVQIVAFPQQGFLRLRDAITIFRDAFRLGADVMGCASNLDRNPQGQVDFRSHIDGMFTLAAELDVDLDIHADLGIPERVELDELEVVYAARRTIEYGYQGRVTAGHACALDSTLPDVAAQAIEWI